MDYVSSERVGLLEAMEIRDIIANLTIFCDMIVFVSLPHFFEIAVMLELRFAGFAGLVTGIS
jgi:hypothetical protein